MSQPRSRKSMLHDFRIGELVRLEQPIAPFSARAVLQIVGFRGDTHLRVIPPGGITLLCPYEAVVRTGVAGSARPPQPRFIRRHRKPKAAPRAAAA